MPINGPPPAAQQPLRPSPPPPPRRGMSPMQRSMTDGEIFVEYADGSVEVIPADRVERPIDDAIRDTYREMQRLSNCTDATADQFLELRRQLDRLQQLQLEREMLSPQQFFLESRGNNYAVTSLEYQSFVQQITRERDEAQRLGLLPPATPAEPVIKKMMVVEQVQPLGKRRLLIPK